MEARRASAGQLFQKIQRCELSMIACIAALELL